jgi:DNA-binding PadR family transcriptional regulator
MYSGGVTEQTLLILASFDGDERHGYGIVQTVDSLSGGRIRLTAGTLYGALGRLADEGLIVATKDRIVDGRRRRYYRLTGSGEAALASEVERMRVTADTLGRRLSARQDPRPA